LLDSSGIDFILLRMRGQDKKDAEIRAFDVKEGINTKREALFGRYQPISTIMNDIVRPMFL
jgi:hypothetical protein